MSVSLQLHTEIMQMYVNDRVIFHFMKCGLVRSSKWALHVQIPLTNARRFFFQVSNLLLESYGECATIKIVD